MNRKKKFLYFFIVVLLFITGELILRIGENLKPKNELNYAQAPYFLPHHFLNYALNPKNSYHNSVGFRGEEISKVKGRGVYRIFCLGGSSVYGSRVSGKESYPYLLGGILKEDFPDKRFEVINAGVPGYTSANLFIQFQFQILPLLPDMIIVYAGFNDIFPRILGIDAPDYSGFDKTWQPVPVLRRLLFSSMFCQKIIGRIGEAFKISFLTWPPHIHELIQVRPYQYYHGNYKNNFANTTPRVFQRNILSLVQLARANGVEVILVTQALGPRKETDQALFEILKQGIAEHNQAIRELSVQTGVYLIDLENLFTADESLFVDEIHMSLKGNKLRAEIISENILGINRKD